MKLQILLKLGFAAFCLSLSACERQVSFSADIAPILADSCSQCHAGSGEGQVTSGLDLASYQGVMAGTSYGPVVVPGNSMSSALYLTVAGATDPAIHMPPHHVGKLAMGSGEPLSARQIESIRMWIDQGAKDN